jgi:hypothetical protein
MNGESVNITGMFKANDDIVQKAISEIPESDWFRTPGDDSNHLLWIMGHLVWSRGNVLRSLKDEVTIPWASMFARGETSADHAQYPTVREIKETWQEISQRLMKSLKAPPADLLAKAAPEGRPSFDGKVSGLVAFLAFHETYHVGQISYLRKWLGYGQSVG